MVSPLTLAKYGWSFVGKPLMRSLVRKEDPSTYTDAERILVKILGINIKLDQALRDIKRLEGQVSQLTDAVDTIDKKLEWYHRIDRISPILGTANSAFADLAGQLDTWRQQGLSGDALRDALRSYVTSTRDYSDYDFQIAAMHRVILDLDERNRALSKQTAFDAYEAWMVKTRPSDIQHANPRLYFRARYDLFDRLAQAQTKLATLSALHFDAHDEPDKADAVDDLLTNCLTAQYAAFLQDLPPLVLAANATDDKLRFTARDFVMRSRAKTQVSRAASANDKAKPGMPTTAIKTQADDDYRSFYIVVGWDFEESGPRDAKEGLVFDITMDAFVMADRGRWSLRLTAPEKVFDGWKSNNQTVYVKRRQLALGRQIEGKKVKLTLPAHLDPMVSVFNASQLAEFSMDDDTIQVALGMVTPTRRELRQDSFAVDTGGASSLNCEGATRMRIASTSPTGSGGDALTRRQIKSHGDYVFAAEPDRSAVAAAVVAGFSLGTAVGSGIEDASVAGLGPDCPNVIPTPAIAYRPEKPAQPRVIGWHRDLNDRPTRRGVWQNGFLVRYMLVGQNRVSSSKATEVAPEAHNTWRDAEHFWGSPGSGCLPMIALPPLGDRTLAHALFRRMKGEAEYTEVTDIEVVPNGGPGGEVVWIDRGGWID